MGNRRKRALGVQFDGKLRLDFLGAKVTSDAGLLPFREPHPWPAAGVCLQRLLRMSRCTPGLARVVPVQPARRFGAGPAAAWQSRQRQVLAASAAAGHRAIPKYFRGDAAFAIPALYCLLEEESFQYAIRIPANNVLMDRIGQLLTRPVGRPSHRPKVLFESFSYQAQSWDRPRRVVAKVEWHASELFPRVGFIVTNMTGWSRKVVRFYNGRGTAEQWIKEGKYAVKWTRLSCRDFKDNQVGLQLFALAYNLGNFCVGWRCRGRSALVADHAAREADQGRGEGGPARHVRDVPIGRGGGAA